MNAEVVPDPRDPRAEFEPDPWRWQTDSIKVTVMWAECRYVFDTNIIGVGERRYRVSITFNNVVQQGRSLPHDPLLVTARRGLPDAR